MPRVLFGSVSVAILLSGCGERESAPAPSSASPLDDFAESQGLRLSNSGADTERADAVLGGPASVQPLDALPRLAQSDSRAPGSPLHPARFIELAEPVSGERLAAAYQHAYDELDGMNGWFPLAETADGWADIVTGSQVTTSRRVACGIDLIEAMQLEDDVEQGLRELGVGCARLHRELGGRLGAPLDEHAILEQARRMAAVADAHGLIELRFWRPGGFRFRDVHATLRGLGLTRSDFGSYAWYNDQPLGFDRLIVVDPGIHPDAIESDEDRTPDFTVRLSLLDVPLPHVVAERTWTVAETLQRRLGSPPRLVPAGAYRPAEDIPPTDRARFFAHTEHAIRELRAVGFFTDLVAAPE
ncbi:MAG: hypothetical protein AB7S26_36640 [Sandaracinaceae bacterium]